MIAVALMVALIVVAAFSSVQLESPGLTRRKGPACFNKRGTHSGTSAPNVIVGSVGNDSFVLRAGNDAGFGLSGRDRLCGGGGDDRLIGGDGFDYINGGAGEDHCEGELERRCEG